MIIVFLSIYIFSFLILVGVNFINPHIFKFFNLTLKEPEPFQNEYLSQFKLRKFQFIFNCFLFILFIFSNLYVSQHFLKSGIIQNIILVIAFLTLLICVVSFFASIAFFISWIRTYLIGPNPICDIQDIKSFHG